jgi:hypothetical protein
MMHRVTGPVTGVRLYGWAFTRYRGVAQLELIADELEVGFRDQYVSARFSIYRYTMANLDSVNVVNRDSEYD